MSVDHYSGQITSNRTQIRSQTTELRSFEDSRYMTDILTTCQVGQFQNFITDKLLCWPSLFTEYRLTVAWRVGPGSTDYRVAIIVYIMYLKHGYLVIERSALVTVRPLQP